MKKEYIFLLTIVLPFLLGGCGYSKDTSSRHHKALDPYANLESELQEYVAGKDASIGVAVITEQNDTISINGHKPFPMMSVFKFPLALAVAKWIDVNNKAFGDSISIPVNQLREDTYSPMLKKYREQDVIKITLHELMEWSLIESDNNAADLLIEMLGGVEGTNNLLSSMALNEGYTIGATEEDMHRDVSLVHLNNSTPVAMAALFKEYDNTLRHRSNTFNELGVMLEQCRTGLDRIPAPFTTCNAIIGHKTGTGDKTADGRISALNDCGYIHLPDGKEYYLAVFIINSAYDMNETAGIIAHISEIVFHSIAKSEK